MANYTGVDDGLWHVDCAWLDMHQWRWVSSCTHYLQQCEQSAPVIRRMDVCRISLEQVMQAVRHVPTDGMYHFRLHHQQHSQRTEHLLCESNKQYDQRLAQQFETKQTKGKSRWTPESTVKIHIQRTLTDGWVRSVTNLSESNLFYTTWTCRHIYQCVVHFKHIHLCSTSSPKIFLQTWSVMAKNIKPVLHARFTFLTNNCK